MPVLVPARHGRVRVRDSHVEAVFSERGHPRRRESATRRNSSPTFWESQAARKKFFFQPDLRIHTFMDSRTTNKKSSTTGSVIELPILALIAAGTQHVAATPRCKLTLGYVFGLCMVPQPTGLMSSGRSFDASLRSTSTRSSSPSPFASPAQLPKFKITALA